MANCKHVTHSPMNVVLDSNKPCHSEKMSTDLSEVERRVWFTDSVQYRIVKKSSPCLFIDVYLTHAITRVSNTCSNTRSPLHRQVLEWVLFWKFVHIWTSVWLKVEIWDWDDLSVVSGCQLSLRFDILKIKIIRPNISRLVLCTTLHAMAQSVEALRWSRKVSGSIHEFFLDIILTAALLSLNRLSL